MIQFQDLFRAWADIFPSGIGPSQVSLAGSLPIHSGGLVIAEIPMGIYLRIIICIVCNLFLWLLFEY